MSDCTHHWTVTSECPLCLRARVRELEAEIERLRDELRGRTQNFDDACTTLAKVEADLLTLQSRHERVLIAGAEVRERAERAEAERDALRSRNEVLGDQLDAINDDLTNIMAERDALRALLREAREELTTWMYHGHGNKTSGFGSAPLCNRIDAALKEKS